MIKKEMLEKKTWAVVGVTTDKARYGYKIWTKLQGHNYKAYGVNPKYDEIEGETVYGQLKDLPEKVDVVDLVVPPHVSKDLLDEIKDQGIDYVWFQPGTFNEQVIEKAKDLDLKILYDDCIYATLDKLEDK